MGTEETATALTINGAVSISRSYTLRSLDIRRSRDIVILKYLSDHFIPYFVGINTVEKFIKRGRLLFDSLE